MSIIYYTSYELVLILFLKISNFYLTFTFCSLLSSMESLARVNPRYFAVLLMPILSLLYPWNLLLSDINMLLELFISSKYDLLSYYKSLSISSSSSGLSIISTMSSANANNLPFWHAYQSLFLDLSASSK